MKIEIISNLVIGKNKKDYELISYSENKGQNNLSRRKKNDTCWNITLDGFIELKLVSNELAGEDYLSLPKEGFYLTYWIHLGLMNLKEKPLLKENSK
jgi:hypothetical protein